MSRRTSPSIRYKCVDDCHMGGCPGHILTLVHNITTDHFEVWVDNKISETFDEHKFQALLEANKQLNER